MTSANPDFDDGFVIFSLEVLTLNSMHSDVALSLFLVIGFLGKI